MRQIRTILLCVCLGVLAMLHMAKFAAHTTDDAFITYRYAWNLVQGRGLTYNPDERVEGLSNPGFAVLLAIMARVGVPPPDTARVLGLVSLVLLALVVSRAPEPGSGRGAGPGPGPDPEDLGNPDTASPRGDGAPAGAIPVSLPGGRDRDGAPSPLPGLLLVAASPVACWAIGGLETLPYALVLTMTGLLAVEGRFEAGLAGAVLATLRPEGSLVALAAIGGRAVVDRRGVLRMLGALVAGLVIFHGVRIAFYGSVLPHTFWAKHLAASSQIPGVLGYLYRFLVESIPSLLLGLAVLGGWASPAEGRVFGLMILAELAAIASVGGDWMPLSRLLVPLIPLVVILARRGATALAGALRERGLTVPRPVTAVLFGLVALQLFRVPPESSSQIRKQVALGQLMDRTALALGDAGAGPAVPTMALGDIGRIGYRLGWTVLDLRGLVSPAAVAGFAPDPDGTGIRPDPDWMFQREPDWILLAIEADTGLGYWPTDRAVLEDPRLEEHYELHFTAKVPDLSLVYRAYLRRGSASRPGVSPGPVGEAATQGTFAGAHPLGAGTGKGAEEREGEWEWERGVGNRERGSGIGERGSGNGDRRMGIGDRGTRPRSPPGAAPHPAQC